MRKSILFSDGCDILIYNSQGHLIGEHNDIPRDLVVSVLNKLNSPEVDQPVVTPLTRLPTQSKSA